MMTKKFQLPQALLISLHLSIWFSRFRQGKEQEMTLRETDVGEPKIFSPVRSTEAEGGSELKMYDSCGATKKLISNSMMP